MMYDVRTKLLSLDEDIFIPELSFSLNFYLPYHFTHYFYLNFNQKSWRYIFCDIVPIVTLSEGIGRILLL